MQHFSKLVKTALVLTIGLFVLSGCDKNTDKASVNYRSVEQIKDSGSINIGVFSDKYPFGYVNAQGEISGYDVYFAKRIGADLLGDEAKVNFVYLDAASRVSYLETGKVDITLANFTVTKERAEKVDFALPYMKVALGVVSPTNKNITAVDQLKGKTLIVVKGTTAETYFTKNYPEIKLLKFDEYQEAYDALLDKRGDAFSTDNTEVLAWAIKNKGFTVGIDSLGNTDTIAPAVAKGNLGLKNWIDNEIKSLAGEAFFLNDYKATLHEAYGDTVDPKELVVEGGKL